jgi:hypothetical protein
MGYEITSYQKDAVSLINNRVLKKLREAFQTLHEFAAFQEEVQAMAKYDSKFNINEAF